jgi:mannose-6-phosphate isomerase-like protein (cupin superfamily)
MRHVEWQTVQAAENYDVLAPDGSQIRLLVTVGGASMVHCRLLAGQVGRAVRHRTVEEVWFCLSGAGLLWRQGPGQRHQVVELRSGIAVSIPIGVAFQFRARGRDPMDLVITTIPPWPGPEAAEVVDGYWSATV